MVTDVMPTPTRPGNDTRCGAARDVPQAGEPCRHAGTGRDDVSLVPGPHVGLEDEDVEADDHSDGGLDELRSTVRSRTTATISTAEAISRMRGPPRPRFGPFPWSHCTPPHREQQPDPGEEDTGHDGHHRPGEHPPTSPRRA
ncbi:hypothetical protein [Actinomycetospora straminea]|uniref:Uncharacterized protein n=1 Tax=Actinomycetospora straminea TaxID=663607 RepID=A0ABP9FCE0_9PSEU|nr:hypothetical protein [Actinomycetospora straminea]MDD7936790.1 hypothetical protein [Actinomycetospora straminea]